MVSPQQHSAIDDLGHDEPPGKLQAAPLIACGCELATRSSTSLFATPVVSAINQPPVEEMADGNAPGGQVPQRLRKDLHVAHEAYLGDVQHAQLCPGLPPHADHDALPGPAHLSALFLYVQRHGIVAGGEQAAHLGLYRAGACIFRAGALLGKRPVQGRFPRSIDATVVGERPSVVSAESSHSPCTHSR